MKKQYLLVLLLNLCTLVGVKAQRYLTPQFTTVTKTTAVYGQNFTAITLFVIGHTARQALVCDIYQPTGDTTSASRPMMIFIPTGNFLPKSVRRNPLGDRTDSIAVEMCTRFAKLGYVTAAIVYRQGWNPIASQQADRAYGLINAIYRGIQDGRSAVRYFKTQAAALRIDTNRIMVIGDGTGGYISLGMASLDKYSEILTTKYLQGKFTSWGNMSIPMIIETYNGNIYGSAPDTATRSPQGYPYNVGDTLFVPNWGKQTSNYRLTVNMGGAVGDISWLDSISTPIISIAAPHDQNAPYRDGILSSIGLDMFAPIFQVQGSQWVTLKADTLGINNAFKKILPSYDPHKALVAPRNAASGFGATYASGLFPILGRSTNDASPYQWWSKDTTIETNKYGLDSAALASNPGMSAAKARLYIDSIMAFIVPRACVGMDLPCGWIVTSTAELKAHTPLIVSPNPAQSTIRFESASDNPIQAIQIYDIAGHLIQSINKVNKPVYELQRGDLLRGLYVAKVTFEDAVVTKKIVFDY